jgi:hypothetical protein
MLKISHANRRFVRHYVEMVVVMFAGMIVLGLPIEGALKALGTGSSEISDDAPAVALLGMATIMTVPMVAWMRRMGHAWAPCSEMGASMFVPTFFVIALMEAGTLDYHGAMGYMHVLMLPAMLAVMLLRRAEYSACHVTA